MEFFLFNLKKIIDLGGNVVKKMYYLVVMENIYNRIY